MLEIRNGLTAYHSAIFAAELTVRHASDDPAKLGASLLNASVDLNPHQVDAALFAFRSPLSRGSILAEEVGLGKTIEAGLVLSQLWAEHKRRILVIAPTILRKQWAQELAEKFHIPSLVIDANELNVRRKRSESPFEPDDQVVIVSYNFVWSKESEVGRVPWDLVIIDEAHRLRNVWKSGNKIASSILKSIGNRPLLLLTATPLQNSLIEIYGLVSFIDPHLFGSIEAFRSRYMRGPTEERQLAELKQRLAPVCHRTLRRQVTEYVRFTNRIPITQDFTPSENEARLYELVSDYLQREELHAMPNSQRQLMTLILRKLLASSSYAISGTLQVLADRLGRANDEPILEVVATDYESADETQEEWSNSAQDSIAPDQSDALGIQAEFEELKSFVALANSITINSKGVALLQALEKGFTEMKRLGAAPKAVIFTESRRTQKYLAELLAESGYAGRVLTINGVNADDGSGAIYKAWRFRHEGESVVTGNKAVDLRAALVEQFKDHCDILVATEAASEGVNLQFCSLVVNFDLPWNPQRIEQRIGRCHRYGQKHDVVVVNFVNRSNEADQRVFQLLSEKFKLFDGVFGASDEILGALESGVDFERRIAEIYQSCRTTAQIDQAFNDLRSELEEEVQARMSDTRSKLLENFDEEVRQKLKISQEESIETLDRLGRALWNLSRFELSTAANFHEPTLTVMVDGRSLTLSREPFGHSDRFRLSDPVAEAILWTAKSRKLEVSSLAFDLSQHNRKIGTLEPYVGRSGWLCVLKVTIKSLESEDHLVSVMVDEDGERLHPECGSKLFDLSVVSLSETEVPDKEALALDNLKSTALQETLASNDARNRKFFEEEIEKLERWADDLKHALESELRELDTRIKEADKAAKLAQDLESKLKLHREKKELEQLRNQKRRELYEEQDKVDDRKNDLIESVAARLHRTVEVTDLFTIRWKLT